MNTLVNIYNMNWFNVEESHMSVCIRVTLLTYPSVGTRKKDEVTWSRLLHV